MQSFHQSRGRIFFEVVCALTVGASCYVAWLQTGAWALLPAAAAIGLYSLVRLTDLTAPKPAKAVALQPAREPEPVAEVVPELTEPAVEAEPAKPKTPRSTKPRRTKTMRKGGRRAGDESEPVAAAVPVPRQKEDAISPTAFDEAVHSNIEPLFEPEPFVRMPRPAFGRKAG